MNWFRIVSLAAAHEWLGLACMSSIDFLSFDQQRWQYEECLIWQLLRNIILPWHWIPKSQAAHQCSAFSKVYLVKSLDISQHFSSQNPSPTSPADTFQNRTFWIHLINPPASPTSIRSAIYFGYRWSRTVMHFWKVRIRTWSICTFTHTWSLSPWFMWPGVKLPKSSLWTSNQLKFVTCITRWCEKNLFQGVRRLSVPLPALTSASKIMVVVKLHYDLRLVELFDMDEHY